MGSFRSYWLWHSRPNCISTILHFASTALPPMVDNFQEPPAANPRHQGSAANPSSELASMDSMRMAEPGSFALWQPCCRCGQAALGWDTIVGKSYCPACVEAIVQGQAEPIIERTQRRPCTACRAIGSVTVQTYPLKSSQPVEIDLCPEHLRGLLGRRLAAHAYAQLQRQLLQLGLDAQDVFLLHEAFYDAKGRALQPAGEPE
jgi:hypothetical protein